MEFEIWKPVPDFEKFYEVSNFGNVRSLDRVIEQLNFKNNIVKVKYKGRNIKLRMAKNGYLYFNARTQLLSKTLKPHRLVGLLFVDNVENKPEINHKDGNKLNNKYDNLEWCTSSENKKHAMKTGLLTNNFGEKAHAVKTKLQVYKNNVLIKELYGEKEINDFGLTSCGVWSTINNKQKTHRGFTFKRIEI